MSKDVKSLITGASMLVAGILLRLFGGAIDVPVVSLRLAGLVLIVLGVIELVITGAIMLFPRDRRSSES